MKNYDLTDNWEREEFNDRFGEPVLLDEKDQGSCLAEMSELRPITEWLKELPDGYRERAIAQHNKTLSGREVNERSEEEVVE